MSSVMWEVSEDVVNLLAKVKNKFHNNLSQATFALAFDESNAFVKNKFNWGKTLKFSEFNKLWQKPTKFDFAIVLSSSVWSEYLDDTQKEAIIDLHLCRCDAEYEPEVVLEGKKKIKVKDEHGRIKYTNTIKLDSNGNPKWKLDAIDMDVLSKNVKHYGLWSNEFLDIKNVISQAEVTCQ